MQAIFERPSEVPLNKHREGVKTNKPIDVFFDFDVSFASTSKQLNSIRPCKDFAGREPTSVDRMFQMHDKRDSAREVGEVFGTSHQFDIIVFVHTL